LLLHRTASAGHYAQHGERINAKHQSADQSHNNGADSDAASTQAETSRTAAILDIVTLTVAFPFHIGLTWQLT
jgi:hypothetical protein